MINRENINIFNDDAMSLYDKWESPIVIVADGPYGVSGFKGDLFSPKGLAEWYEPHIRAWSKRATAQTTLWFWNTEVGWATVHPVLEKYGWDYKACHIWDKGLSHVAGNTNTKTIRHLPVVSEVCVQYTYKPRFFVGHKEMTMKDWLRYEWARTGLPFSKTNEACGVVNAATRKYFTKCHLWYMPPVDMFTKIVEYANKYGMESGKPYFTLNGVTPINATEWERMRSKFYCPFGVTNVWTAQQLGGKERIKNGTKAAHLNQKPLDLITRIIEISSDKGDIVWDPFGGLFTTAVACYRTQRVCYSAEIIEATYKIGEKRIQELLGQKVP